MKNKKCLTCSQYKTCNDSFVSWIFFIIGIIATIAVRIVTVLIHVKPIFGQIAWYIGIGGFFLFFIYKYVISQRRAALIEKNKLLKKIENQTDLTQEDYTLVGSILCSLMSKKERINYFIIFGLSLLAILIAVYVDFVR